MRHPHDAPGLAQDDLDLAGVAVPAVGELDRLGARLDRREVDDARPRPWRRSSGSRPGRRRRAGAARRRAAARASAISAGRSSPGTISPRPPIASDLDPVSHRPILAHAPGPGAGRRACRCPRPSGPSSSMSRAPAAAAAAECARWLSPPKHMSMTSGGASNSAFVPRPWRSATIATSGGGVAGHRVHDARPSAAGEMAAGRSAGPGAPARPPRSPRRVPRAGPR